MQNSPIADTRRAGFAEWAGVVALLLAIGFLTYYDCRGQLRWVPEAAADYGAAMERPRAPGDAATNPTTAAALPADGDESGIQSLIVQVAERHEIDAALIMAMVQAESRYDPNAVSEMGAQGLMQLMPETARSLGVADSFDPEENLDGGIRYFKRLLERLGGDITLALAAYNAGMRQVRKHSGVPPFKTTRRYIRKVFEYYHELKARLAARAVGKA